MPVTALRLQAFLEDWEGFLADNHYQEWLRSAVSEEIIRLNVGTVSDPRILDEILGRNMKRRTKHSDHLVPAWVATGVDPVTSETTLQGVQVKSDNPPKDAKGKVQKYLSTTGMETAPLFLRTGKSDFWESVLSDKTQRIIITEGAKKAGAGLSLGYPTISIPGVTSCRKKGRLHYMLEPFASLGRTFYLCFDNDILTKRSVYLGLLALSAKLAKDGSNIMVVELPPGPAKGMDDFIAANGRESFDKLIDEAATFEEWKSDFDDAELEDDRPKSKIARNFEMIQDAWGESLRYNSLKKDIEFNGSSLNAEYLKLMVGLQFPVDISKDDAFTIVEFLAKKNTYSPVVEYLDEVEAKFPDIDTAFLDDLAKQFFGTDDPLHAKYFKNFLVASVARARVPGCWMDAALLLCGEQGIRKSTFWRTLYGDDFFSDDLGDGSDKDERMKMHRFWCLEWAEFQSVYKRKDRDQLKAFLGRVVETFRTPYDRLPKDYKRSCLFVGTTNEKEILDDPTGSRRFWIIPCNGAIPVDDVQKMRDRIWAAANALFKSGYTYRLEHTEEVARESQNEEYEVTHPWAEILETFLVYKEQVTVQECFNQLGIDPVHQHQGNQRQITSILRKMEFENVRIRSGNRLVRVWRKKIDVSKNDLFGGSGGSKEESKPETHTQQTVQPEPLENDPVDQPGIIQEPRSEPLEEKRGIAVSQAHSNGSSHSDPSDPAIHRENISPNKTVSEQPDSTEELHSPKARALNKLDCPPLDSYYSEFKVKPMKLSINVGYGDIEFLATPYKKMSTSSRLHFLVNFPDGKHGSFTQKMSRTKEIDLKVAVKRCQLVINWHSSIRDSWQTKVGQDFTIRRLNNDIHSDTDYFSQLATLVSVPSYPTSEKFVFRTISGDVVPVALEDIECLSHGE